MAHSSCWFVNLQGAPLGPAVKHGSVWTRRFARGTHVTFDEASGIGKIAWASALPSSLSSASSLSPAALKTAQRPSSPAAAGSRLVFGAPQRLGAVGWGLDAVVQTSYNVLAYGVADGAMLTRDGGKTFSACSAAVCGQIGDIYARPNGAVTAKPGVRPCSKGWEEGSESGEVRFARKRERGGRGGGREVKAGKCASRGKKREGEGVRGRRKKEEENGRERKRVEKRRERQREKASEHTYV